MGCPVSNPEPVNAVNNVTDVTSTKSNTQRFLEEMNPSLWLYKEDFQERVMLQMFAGGATMEDVSDVVKCLYAARGEVILDADLQEEIYEWWARNRNLVTKSKSIHSQVVDYIESNKCNNPCDNLLQISLQDCYRDLGLKTADEKTACRMAVKRLVERDALEPVSGRVGTYKIVQTIKLAPMKFITEKIPDFPIILPLDLNDMVKIYAKNIIVIAGSKSAGKSMFALWIAIANQHRMPIEYFNSEMGDEEYSDRMQKLGFTSPDQIKFNVYPLHDNYDQYITAERKIFIVDFLEIHDNFYEIAKPIRKIHEKLKDGVCIVLAQMPVGGKMALGKGFSAEKARLYLSLDYDEDLRSTKVSIYDAKTQKQNDIRGMYRHIKIINGAKISPIDNWHHDFKGGR